MTRHQTPATGLTAPQVRERKNSGLGNDTSIKVSKSVFQIFVTNIFTYFNLIFAVLGVFVCTAFDGKDWSFIFQLSFLLVVIANTIIGIVQELRAKRVLDKMIILNAPKTTVIRDGVTATIPSADLVKDDLIILNAGNTIPADARICTGTVAVNESLLTGEEREIKKQPGDELFSGSWIAAGTCTAILEKVGSESYAAKLSVEAKKMKRSEQSEMTVSVNNLLKWIGIIILPVGILLFINSFVAQANTYANSVFSVAGAITAMIPEGLYLLMSVVLAVGTVRLAKRRVLLHEMKSIESLARVDILCVDKTGTITQPKMQIASVMEFTAGAADKLKTYVSDAVDSNSTMQALKEYYADATGTGENAAPALAPLEVTAFSSSTKYGFIRYADETLYLGAPEFLLSGDALAKFSAATLENIKKGERVLVLAKESDTEKTAIAAVMLNNALRENAVETFSYFYSQGVAIKVISGDNPVTVSEVARRAGIEGAEKYVDATTLVSEEDIEKAATAYTVFGRVTPAQKRSLVLALKKAGHTVAMTGDGVNDILAMKDADCSIAMASGSDAACQASQVVLLDSDFSCMPDVVLEGRRAINNLQRSAILFLSKNTFSLILSLMALILCFTYPLQPSQIMIVSVFTIGLPGLLLAVEPNKARIKGKFIKNVLLKALPAGITSSLSITVMALYGAWDHANPSVLATCATIVLATVGFMILRRISSPMSKYRVFVYLFSIAGFIAAALFLPWFFGLVALPVEDIIAVALIIAVAEGVFYFVSKGVDRILDKEMKKDAART
ncbi:MAG TPA: HAD-IC family P-type ATPase [Methanocorpusculum sp.]|nr:HAD-IC family P-type ATPase [Methanocorpusculum sp.]